MVNPISSNSCASGSSLTSRNCMAVSGWNSCASRAHGHTSPCNTGKAGDVGARRPAPITIGLGMKNSCQSSTAGTRSCNSKKSGTPKTCSARAITADDDPFTLSLSKGGGPVHGSTSSPRTGTAEQPLGGLNASHLPVSHMPVEKYRSPMSLKIVTTWPDRASPAT